MFPKEKFLFPRPRKTSSDLKIAWYYPNTYTVGMAGLGYQLVFSLLDQDDDVQIFRGFTDMEEPGIKDCQLIGFTLSWELDYSNIIALLKKHDIPLSSRDRNENHPIVFGGGPVLTANPEPFSDIFDVVLLGDAEVAVPSFIAAYREAKKISDRKDQLISIANTDGIYVPALYKYEYESRESENDGGILSIAPLFDGIPDKPRKRIFTPPQDYVAHTQILSPDTAWGNMFLVEVVRSCPQECRFCLASYLTRPFRSTNVDSLIHAIETGLEHTNKIGLLGPSVTEHPRFDEIAERLKTRTDLSLSIASIRADTVSAKTLSVLKTLGQKSVTIAIESGSERLRAIMKKNLTEAEIINAVDMIEAAGLESIKFYGIAGLPHETQEDIEETVRLMTMLKKTHKRLRFVFGISSFVPKAQTPFQWYGRDKTCAKKLEYVRKNLAKIGIDVRPESHNWSDIQTLLSRGDRRLTPLIQAVAENSGNLGAWKKQMKETVGTPPVKDYYIYRNIPEDEILPWSHLQDEEKTQYLAKHRDAAASLSLQPAVI
ncbi:MAG: radical SAM protein [Leptolyngbya sp.]|nr:radical SAM protein [Candidatus Melainabacteria bacterium]